MTGQKISQPKTIAVIPARYGSTRFPGKPLALIAGKPLLQWTIEGARKSRAISALVVATDDERIARLARDVGAEVAMTASDLPTGTDRVRAALAGRDYDVAINVQGDEPLLDGAWLDALAAPFAKDASLEMATLGRPLTEEALLSPNTAKIVLNARGEAIYFSRFPIPYSRMAATQDARLERALKHIGLYAYRKSFLEKFCDAGPCALEEGESLEQLRALYLGARIQVVLSEAESWGVDTPEDVRKIEKLMVGRSAQENPK